MADDDIFSLLSRLEQATRPETVAADTQRTGNYAQPALLPATLRALWEGGGNLASTVAGIALTPYLRQQAQPSPVVWGPEWLGVRPPQPLLPEVLQQLGDFARNTQRTDLGFASGVASERFHSAPEQFAGQKWALSAPLDPLNYVGFVQKPAAAAAEAATNPAAAAFFRSLAAGDKMASDVAALPLRPVVAGAKALAQTPVGQAVLAPAESALVTLQKRWQDDLIGGARTFAENRGWAPGPEGFVGDLAAQYGGASAMGPSPAAAGAARAQAEAQAAAAAGPVATAPTRQTTQEAAEAAKAALGGFNWDRDLKQLNGYAQGDHRNIDKALDVLGVATQEGTTRPLAGPLQAAERAGGWDSGALLSQVRQYIEQEGRSVPGAAPLPGGGFTSTPGEITANTLTTAGQAAKAYEDLAARGTVPDDARARAAVVLRFAQERYGPDFPSPPPGVQQYWAAIQRQMGSSAGEEKRVADIAAQLVGGGVAPELAQQTARTTAAAERAAPNAAATLTGDAASIEAALLGQGVNPAIAREAALNQTGQAGPTVVSPPVAGPPVVARAAPVAAGLAPEGSLPTLPGFEALTPARPGPALPVPGAPELTAFDVVLGRVNAARAAGRPADPADLQALLAGAPEASRPTLPNMERAAAPEPVAPAPARAVPTTPDLPTLRNMERPPAPVAAVPDFAATLPADLGRGGGGYRTVKNVEFASDVDRALYIVADGVKRSKRDADYLAFLQRAVPGADEAALRAAGRAVRGEIRQEYERLPEGATTLRMDPLADVLLDRFAGQPTAPRPTLPAPPPAAEALPTLPNMERAAPAPDLPTRPPLPGDAAAENLTPPAPAVGPAGKDVTIQGPSGTPYDFRYRVLPLDELIPSQDPRTLVDNPAYLTALQDRLRGKAASGGQVGKIVSGWEPGKIVAEGGQLAHGPQIIGPDRMVESGNGRTMAMLRLRDEAPEKWQAYQDMLADRVEQFGLSPDVLRGVRDPVLVRERVTEFPDLGARQRFVEEANVDETLGKSAFEVARNDARNLNDELVGTVTSGAEDTLDANLRTASNREFVNQWLRSLQQRGEDLSTLVDDRGQLGPAGYERLKRALFVKTFPGPEGARLAEALQDRDAVRDVASRTREGIFNALPDLAPAEALVRAGRRGDPADPEASLSIAGDLAAATWKLIELRLAGKPVPTYFREFEGSFADHELTPLQEELLKFFDENARSGRAIQGVLRDYGRRVQALPDTNPAQNAMFDLPAAPLPTRGELLDAAMQTARQEEVDAGRFAAADTAATANRAAVEPTAGSGGELARPAAELGGNPPADRGGRAPAPAPAEVAPAAPAVGRDAVRAARNEYDAAVQNPPNLRDYYPDQAGYEAATAAHQQRLGELRAEWERLAGAARPAPLPPAGEVAPRPSSPGPVAPAAAAAEPARITHVDQLPGVPPEDRAAALADLRARVDAQRAEVAQKLADTRGRGFDTGFTEQQLTRLEDQLAGIDREAGLRAPKGTETPEAPPIGTETPPAEPPGSARDLFGRPPEPADVPPPDPATRELFGDTTDLQHGLFGPGAASPADPGMLHDAQRQLAEVLDLGQIGAGYKLDEVQQYAANLRPLVTQYRTDRQALQTAAQEAGLGAKATTDEIVQRWSIDHAGDVAGIRQLREVQHRWIGDVLHDDADDVLSAAALKQWMNARGITLGSQYGPTWWREATTAWRQQALFSPRYHVQNIADGVIKSLLFLGNTGFTEGARPWRPAEGWNLLKEAGRASGGEDIGTTAVMRLVSSKYPDLVLPSSVVSGGLRRSIGGGKGLENVPGVGRLIRANMELGRALEESMRTAAFLQTYEKTLAAGGTNPEAYKAGTDEATRLFFDYENVTKLDSFLRNVFGFHMYSTRNFALYAPLLAEHPLFLRALHDYDAATEEGAAERGTTKARRYAEGVPVNLGEQLARGLFAQNGIAFWNPTAYLGIGEQVTGTPQEYRDETGAGKLLGRARKFGLGLAPWIDIPLALTGIYGGRGPQPLTRFDPLLESAWNRTTGRADELPWRAVQTLRPFGGRVPNAPAMLVRMRLSEMALEREPGYARANPFAPVPAAYLQAMREGPGNALFAEAAQQVAQGRLAEWGLGWGGLPLTFQGETAGAATRAQAGIPTVEDMQAQGWTKAGAERQVELQRQAQGAAGTLYGEAFRRPFGERGGLPTPGAAPESERDAIIREWTQGTPAKQQALLADPKANAVIQAYRASQFPASSRVGAR